LHDACFCFPGPAASFDHDLLGILFLLFLVAIIIVAEAIESIYRTVLYDYAVNGRIARNFAPELITNAIKTKK